MRAHQLWFIRKLYHPLRGRKARAATDACPLQKNSCAAVTPFTRCRRAIAYSSISTAQARGLPAKRVTRGECSRRHHPRNVSGCGDGVKNFLACALSALTLQSAVAAELKVGDRIPAVPGEPIVVANDGGLKRGGEVLGFGEVCRVNGWTKNWLLVRRIAADWTLLELVGPSPGDVPLVDYPTSLASECPLGAETSRPASEMRVRLNEYARRSDYEFLQSLR